MTVSQAWDFDLNGYLFRAGTFARLYEVTGLDHPEANFITTAKSGAHGAFTSAKYTKERTITLTGRINTGDPATLPSALTDLRHAFAPSAVDIPFSWLMPGLPLQYAKVKPFTIRYTLTAEGTAVGFTDFVATLVAGDPLIYSTNLYSTTLSPGASSGGISFPVSFPFGFSVGGTSGVVTLTHQGNSDAPTVTHFTGPLTNPVLTNTTTGKFFALNLNILAGDEVVVDSALRTVLYRPVGQLTGGVTRYSSVLTGSSFLEIAGGTSAAESYSASTNAGAGSITVMFNDVWL